MVGNFSAWATLDNHDVSRWWDCEAASGRHFDIDIHGHLELGGRHDEFVVVSEWWGRKARLSRRH